MRKTCLVWCRPLVGKLHRSRGRIRGPIPKEIEPVTGLGYPVAQERIVRIIRRIGPLAAGQDAGKGRREIEFASVDGGEEPVDFDDSAGLELDHDRRVVERAVIEALAEDSGTIITTEGLDLQIRAGLVRPDQQA